MATIRQQPKAPQWPWGGPQALRGQVVNRAQLEKKGVRKKGDPKNPALASTALLDFIGPAHSAEELRLPMPPMPAGHDADVEHSLDRSTLGDLGERAGGEQRQAIDRGLAALKAPPDRIDRLKSLLAREASMLELVSGVTGEMAEIERKRREETAEEAY